MPQQAAAVGNNTLSARNHLKEHSLSVIPKSHQANRISLFPFSCCVTHTPRRKDRLVTSQTCKSPAWSRRGSEGEVVDGGGVSLTKAFSFLPPGPEHEQPPRGREQARASQGKRQKEKANRPRGGVLSDRRATHPSPSKLSATSLTFPCSASGKERDRRGGAAFGKACQGLGHHHPSIQPDPEPRTQPVPVICRPSLSAPLLRTRLVGSSIRGRVGHVTQSGLVGV